MAHRVADTIPTSQRRRRMSYEDYQAWFGDTNRGEWVDGEVIVFMPTTVRHADLAGFLYTLLSHFARFHDLGRVFAESVEMSVRDGRSSRIPDLVFVGRAHADRVTPARIVGAGDLAIELVSDDSVARDRVDKFAEYAAAGVAEHWIQDARSGRQGSDFYRWTADGRYEPIPPDADGRIRSLVLPGFWLRPEWLLADPLPDPLDCLAEIAPEVLQRPRRGGGAADGGRDRA